MPNCSGLTKVVTLAFLVAAVAIMSMAASPAAKAQQPNESLPPLVDLSIASEPRDSGSGREVWDIIVRNNLVADFPGTTAATVKVRVSITDDAGINDPVTEVHTIRDVPAGSEATLSFRYPSPKAMVCGSAPVLSRIHAEIIETDPLEPADFRFNNATENVGMFCGSAAFVNGDTGVDVSVSDRSPQPGGATTFTVMAKNYVGPAVDSRLDHNDNQFDVRVKISLSPGLSFGTTTAPAGTTFSTATGIWEVGTLTTTLSGISKSLPVAVNLTADSLAEIPLNERCLTAEVVRAKPWFAWDHSKRLNDTYTACLGKPLFRLNQGEVNLFHYLDCVGVTTAPCTSADTLELVAGKSLEHITPGNSYAQPDELLVHISDPEGRHDGKWRTGTTRAHDNAVADIPGTAVLFMFLSRDYNAYTFAISDVSPKQRPGTLTIIGGSQGTFKLLDADNLTSTSPFNLPADVTNNPYPALLEFGTLGTYKVQITVGATKSSTAYTATGTYTFHVGPMADLEVRDAGASPAVAAGRRGYTVMALNNGRDIPPAVQVTLSGVPEGAEAVPSHGHGSYTQGTCQNGLCEGVWAIGELGSGNYRASGHANEGPTLTLITYETMPAAITATIANTQDYSVCIDSSGDDVDAASEAACTATSGNTWHSTAYLDHIEKNNTAAITARAGSGDGRPDAPMNLRVVETPVGNIVQWEAVATVNRHEVAHYEIEYAEGGWKVLKGDVAGIVYFDMTDTASDRANRAYRVRAVNSFGVPGSWAVPSASGGAALPPSVPANFRATLITDTDVELTWLAAAEHAEGITHYTVEVSDHAGGPWSQLARPNGGDTRYIHGNLPKTGATKHYRIRAHNRSNYSAWAEASVGLATDDTRVETSLRAQRYTTGQGNHGIQVWFDAERTCDPNQPTDRDDPNYIGCLTVIEFREVGSSAWRFGSENFGEYGIVPWDPDAPYFTEGDGRSYAVRLDTAYDVRVCKLTEAKLEAKLAAGAADGTWCVGEAQGRVRVPAGE